MHVSYDSHSVTSKTMTDWISTAHNFGYDLTKYPTLINKEFLIEKKKKHFNAFIEDLETIANNDNKFWDYLDEGSRFETICMDRKKWYTKFGDEKWQSGYDYNWIKNRLNQGNEDLISLTVNSEMHISLHPTDWKDVVNEVNRDKDLRMSLVESYAVFLSSDEYNDQYDFEKETQVTLF